MQTFVGKMTALTDCQCLRLSLVLLALFSASLPAAGMERGRPSGQATGIASFCQSQYFHAKCNNDEIIMITSAKYGRMRIDRCVTEDFGYIGCSEDVVNYMDWRCSGRTSCSVRVLDESFGNIRPCHGDLKSYLEANYSCVKVWKENASSCLNESPVHLTDGFGYITTAGSRQQKAGCGHRRSGWLIQARPGQRVNITLHDFSAPLFPSQATGYAPATSSARDQGTHAQCRILATISEDPPGRGRVTVCGGVARYRKVYISTGHTVEIRLWGGTISTNNNNNNNNNDSHGAFLLQYEFIGCANLPEPVGGYIKRESHMSLLVGCSHTTQTWRLVCNGTQWAGGWQNCSTAPMAANGSDGEGSSLGFIPLPMKVSIVIIVGLALAIGLLVLATGLVCLRRLPRHPRRGTPDGCRVAYGEHQHPPMEPLYPKATIVYRMRDTQTATSLQYPGSTASTTTSLPDYNNAKNLYSSMNRQSPSSCCRPQADEPDICTCNSLQMQDSPGAGNIAQPNLMCSTSYHALDPVDFGPGAFFEDDRKVLHFESDSASSGLLLSNEGTLNRPEAATAASVTNRSNVWTNKNVPSCNPKRQLSITAHYTANLFDDCVKIDTTEGANLVSLSNRTSDATL